MSHETKLSRTPTILKNERIALLSTYKARRNIPIGTGRILPGIRVEWLVAAKKTEITSVGRMQQLTWWGLEMGLLVIHQDIKRLPFQVEVLGESFFKVIVEGHRPNCYVCGVCVAS